MASGPGMNWYGSTGKLAMGAFATVPTVRGVGGVVVRAELGDGGVVLFGNGEVGGRVEGWGC